MDRHYQHGVRPDRMGVTFVHTGLVQCLCMRDVCGVCASRMGVTFVHTGLVRCLCMRDVCGVCTSRMGVTFVHTGLDIPHGINVMFVQMECIKCG